MAETVAKMWKREGGFSFEIALIATFVPGCPSHEQIAILVRFRDDDPPRIPFADDNILIRGMPLFFGAKRRGNKYT